MKIFIYKTLALMGSCLCFNLSYAENVKLESSKTLIPIDHVEIWVNRALKSQNGTYLLNLSSGYWKPKATLYDLANHQATSFEGLQKGNTISLTSYTPDMSEQARGELSLVGNLNVETGIYTATLKNTQDTLQQAFIFSPLVQVANRPTFLFKFYGVEDQNTHQKYIQKIDVIDRKTKKLYQQLTGFNAYSNSMGYADLNFDGYFDLVLRDASHGTQVENSHSIYWMYNPETKKFQRSPQLEVLGGTPLIYIDKQQVNFGDGQLYQIKNGQFYKVKE